MEGTALPNNHRNNKNSSKRRRSKQNKAQGTTTTATTNDEQFRMERPFFHTGSPTFYTSTCKQTDATVLSLNKEQPIVSNMHEQQSFVQNNNLSSSVPPRPLTARENEIYKKLCEIILTIHKSKEFVSRERVQRELFHYYNVNSWYDLRTQPSRFDALINLTDRQKTVTFYMHVFEQIFNLCTLNDLESLLARFLKVGKYDDLLLGPLDKNPEVQRIFKYQPTNPDQYIPEITTGQVIKSFIEFQKAHRYQRLTSFDGFIDHLVEGHNLQSREELGLFCKSFPYLVQMTNNLRRDQESYMQQVKEQLQKDLIEDVRVHLAEFKEKMHDELELSSFNKKKTPTAVFNYLISVVDKYLNFIPQQPILFAILTHLRDDEMLRCLFNVSIYLGTIDKPEIFIVELKKLYGHQERTPSAQETIMTQQLSIITEKMSKKDRKKMNRMMKQQQSQLQYSNISVDEQIPTTNTTFATPFSTSFSSCLLTSHLNKPKTPVCLKQLCSDIYAHLIHYDTPLTIKQLIKIDEDLCAQYDVTNFSAFTYDENDDDDNSANFILFLNKYRQIIDPHEELSVYEQTTSTDNQTELYSFVEQLSILNNDEINEEHQLQHIALIHGHVNTEQRHISPEKLSAVDKAVKHKFGRSINFRKGNQIIKKARKRFQKTKYTIIRFEESLLDINGLNQLDSCPISLNVNEIQLCQLILHCPLMTNLYTWLQWLNFFQPKYGTLKSFITKHECKFKDLRLLETSTGEVYRLPINASLATFEHELNEMHIRSAVGHLCSLIIEEGLITRFPINVYRTSMDTWFRHLRSLATLQNDHIDPMQHILDFLMYLPILIGQSRIIEELILVPLDKVFGDVSDNAINVRTRLWDLANVQQRIKLELWGHTVNIVEWKNEKKWLGDDEWEETSILKSENEFIQQQQNIDAVNPAVMTSAVTKSLSTVTTNITSIIPTPAAANINDKNDSVQAAFEHIESIRRGFGVDSGLDPTSQSIITNLLGMIERSLERLSNDLYLEQGHFVLELIQNADDNQYTLDRVPTLRFILSSERILVCNNEIGFRPCNIAAICNVGASTKGKHKQGYAGHKGIGFKSVFMISHRPEIHSQNYHLCFDTVNGTQQIGYTLPIWIDQYEEELPNIDEWATCIRLPIKKEAQDARLKENFKKIESIFLLFLNRLRQVEIINQHDISSIHNNNNNNRIFTRIDHVHGQIIELQEKSMNGTIISNLWLVVKKVIEVPPNIKKKLHDVKGDVDSTIIAVAYPLNGMQDSLSSFPPTQPVFAYLPLCSYGFRFILQADFEVPANRQEILHDNLWNEWLKSEMTCLLSLAYCQFQHLPDLLTLSTINTQINYQLTPIQIIKYFLKFFPLQNESKPFFNTFVDKSIQLLMGIIKLPVSHQNEKDEIIIDWVSPSQCVIVRDEFIRKILSQDLLLSHFNSYYVHEQLVHECDEQILLKLGCRQLDFSDITRLIEVSYKQNEQQHLKTTSAIEQIAQWIVCLDYSLQQQREEMNYKERENDTILKLKQLKIIPLKDQSHLVSIDEFDKHTISFPPDKSTPFSKHLKLVLDDIPTLDEQLLNFIEDKYPRRIDSIKRLLQNLGITKAYNIREIYRQHMLPIMSNPTRWSSKSELVLIAYLLCIYEYLYLPNPDIFENELKTLQNKMIIKTHNNQFVSLGSSDVIVHLTSKYGCRNSLESLNLSNYQFLFMSDDYYTEFCRTGLCRNDHDLRSFVKFLKDLNLSEFLLVNVNETSFIDVQQLVDTKWAYLIPQLIEMIHEPFIIQDYRSDEFDKLISPSDESQTVDLELCVQLLQYFDHHHQYVSNYYAGSVILTRPHKFGHHTPIKGIESSFCMSVRQHAWIPVYGDMLLKPGDVYLLPTNSQTSVFRRYIPHLDESKVSLNNSNFIYDILGIKSQVEHRTIFELLMKWSCNLDSESLWNLVHQTNALDIIPCTLLNGFHQSCLDTIENFRHIYDFLASNDETCNLLSRFRLWPIIFIPRTQNTGDFLFVQQTFWNDPISLLSLQDTIVDSNGRIPIRSYYNDDSILTTFFLKILHVELHPTIDDYLPLLSIDQDINKIWQIIEIITKLAVEQSKQNEVREKCLNIEFIPCMSDKQKLVKYTDHPFYPHDIDIANLFSDILSIIRLPGFAIDTYFQEQFRSLFSIETLDKIIQTKVNVENEQLSINLTDFYSCSIDLIQYFLLSKEYISTARSIYLSSVFNRMHFVCVDRIHLSHCYGMNIIKSTSTSYSRDTYIDEQSGKFYILKKYETSEMRYIDTMVDFIVEDDKIRSQLSSYIKRLLQRYQTDGEDGLAKLRENCTDNYEPKWIIPKEIKIDVPIPPSIQQEKPEVTYEEIERLMEEPSARSKLAPKKVTNEENANRLISFPARAGAIESNETLKKRLTKIQTQSKPNDSTEGENISSKSYSNDQNHRASQQHDQPDNEHVVPKGRVTQHTNVNLNENKSNEDEIRSSKRQFIQPHAPMIFSNSTSLPSANFDRIIVSTLTNMDLSMSSLIDESSTTNSFRSVGTQADLITGRQGEEFVFRYLKWKYPNEDIKWINQQEESGRPYDIHMIIKSENNREEFIEVKTTRSYDQNTFSVSIGEVEYLLEHPSNYYIYRVYYADKIDSSTITVINRIKKNLQQKNLKLSMTFESKLNN
ncbi:unnamed protein product [Rotaria sordida]|uniref:Protein NO VEIN C-terminal domain-containing protein n=1 Tax=Rotaria sordida TaxID=392033 RepID=A0A818U8K8_9BILA|nr:unnamed protein product [Rotaria sordida]